MEIRIEHLSMTYPSGKQALKDLNLELKAPSLIGLLGPNGAGKSTLMKLLVAALLPTKGEIRVDGHSLTKTERLLKAQLGYLPQDFGLFDELTVTQFLDYMAALKESGIQRRPFRRQYKRSIWRKRPEPEFARCPVVSANGWVLRRQFWETLPS